MSTTKKQTRKANAPAVSEGAPVGARRQMTICKASSVRVGNQYILHPDIRLSGLWLGKYGFKSGHVVDIICEGPGRMTICVAENQRYGVK
jgi:hypothetical protein